MTDAAFHLPAIQPDALYRHDDARLLLRLSGPAMARARRDGQLRFTRQGTRILYRGTWLIEWLEVDAAGQPGPAQEGGGR